MDRGCSLVEKSTALRIIKNARRKKLIQALMELNGKADIREVVRRVAENEGGGESSSKLRKSVYVSIVQVHIPMMEEAGLIKYDPQQSVIQLNRLPSELKYYLEVVEEGDIPWSVYYLILSSVGLAVGLILGNFLASVLSTLILFTSVFQLRKTYKLRK
jgi:hypothetical protein